MQELITELFGNERNSNFLGKVTPPGGGGDGVQELITELFGNESNSNF